ncbi:unnamed protein product [Urochloa humidicola]
MEFAVGASQSAMKSLVSKLGSLLAQEYALIRGVRGEIQDMSHELASMMAFLRNLNADDPSAEHDHQTEDWMRQVSDMAYDIEDCVDHFAHHLCDEPRGNGCVVAARRGVYELLSWRLRRDIAKKVAELKARAERVGERRVRYGVRDPDISSKGERKKDGSSRAPAYMYNKHGRTEPNLYGMKLELVGAERIMYQIRSLVMGTLQQRKRIVCIAGHGGTGKSTIAMALYHELVGQFDHVAFGEIRRDLDMRWERSQ